MGESISNVGEKSLSFSRKMSTISELPSEDRLNNVRSAFSGVREIIAKADSIVDADQYAYVGGGILTLMFGTVWYWDPSFLTFISFLGFVLTIGDYVVPRLLKRQILRCLNDLPTVT